MMKRSVTNKQKKKKGKRRTNFIRISSAERFQALSDLGVFVDGCLDVGFVKQRFVIINVAQLDVDRAICNVVLVVIVVLALVQ